MTAKKTLILSLAPVLAGVVAAVVLVTRREVATPLAKPGLIPSAGTSVAQTAEPATPGKIATTENKSLVQTVKTDLPPVAKPNQAAAQASPTAKVKEPIQDPDARAALSLVGTDPEAEQYWMAAINDPTLPANERKDLIEDLNEDGLSDPHHPGAQDVPVILNRLRLIEGLAPDAMDLVNAQAFAEAYKDLTDMLAGKPVP